MQDPTEGDGCWHRGIWVKHRNAKLASSEVSGAGVGKVATLHADQLFLGGLKDPAKSAGTTFGFDNERSSVFA
jgi:hypothetical protein